MPALLLAATVLPSTNGDGGAGRGIDRIALAGTGGALAGSAGDVPSERPANRPVIGMRTPPRLVRLNAASSLHPDDGIRSAGGRFALLYRQDGNLVLYGPDGPVWDAGTSGTTAGRVTMQDDGNLVIRDARGRPVWSTDSAGNPRATLQLGDDGTLVVRRADGSTAWRRAATR